MSCLNAVMNNEVLGAITIVDASSITVAGSVYGSGSSTIAIAPNATVWLNNSPATISDLKPGDVVEIDLNPQGQAVMIDATRSQPNVSTAPATGTSADTNNNTNTNTNKNTSANAGSGTGSGTTTTPSPAPAQ